MILQPYSIDSLIIDNLYSIIMLARIAKGLTRTFCASKSVQQSAGSSVIESSKGS